jgi:hypothetical protein
VSVSYDLDAPAEKSEQYFCAKLSFLKRDIVLFIPPEYLKIPFLA